MKPHHKPLISFDYNPLRKIHKNGNIKVENWPEHKHFIEFVQWFCFELYHRISLSFIDLIECLLKSDVATVDCERIFCLPNKHVGVALLELHIVALSSF